MAEIDFREDQTEMKNLYIDHSKRYLFQKFLGICEKFILKILNEKKNHLTPTYLRIVELQTSTTERMSIVPRNSEYLMRQGFLEVDERFEKEKKFIEDLEEKEKEIRKNNILRSMFLTRRKCDGKKIIECVCAVSFVSDELIYCPKGHGFCKDCIHQSIEAAHSRGSHVWTCLEAGCGEEYMDYELRKFLPEEFIENLYSARRNWEAKRVFNDAYKQCPDCGNGSKVDSKTTNIFYCMNNKCRKDWCMVCWERSHGTALCPREVEESEEALARFVSDAMSAARIRRCPVCQKPGIKTERCNRIACDCKATYCYVCQVQTNKNGEDQYAHFDKEKYPNVTCQLYPPNKDTEEFDRLLVRKAGEKAWAEWREKHPKFAVVKLTIEKLFDVK